MNTESMPPELGSRSAPLAVGVIGAGTMGTGIARLLSRAGHQVQVFDNQPGRVAQWLSAEPAADDDAGAIKTSPSLREAAAGADLVIEAVSEDRAVKSRVLREISEHADATAIIATNTSSFPIDVLSRECSRPERFLGIHFFNPADVIPGVEVIPGAATASEVMSTVNRLLTEAGKRPATVQSSPGFIANRLQMALFLECLRCVDEGLVCPDDLDTVVSTTFGFRLPLFGPFAIADMAGLDVYRGILETLAGQYGERFATPPALLEHTDRGEFGLKTGQGFRSYDSRTRVELPMMRDRMYVRLRDALEELDLRQATAD